MDLIWAPVYKMLSQLVKFGPVPKHVAFVMDGNRRYARHRNQQAQEGHEAGYGALRDVLEFCYNSGVKEVSVYAFSIENFKRSPEEVANLMETADRRIKQIVENGDLAMQHGVRVNIIGDRKMLPEFLQKTIIQAEEITKTNHSVVLNICMPYTARDDIAHAIASLSKSKESLSEPSLSSDSITGEVTNETLGQHMYTAHSRPLDLLVRTSGTNRLSDFLLWEITEKTQIYFVETLWPEFTPWHLFKAFILTQLARQSNCNNLE